MNKDDDKVKIVNFKRLDNKRDADIQQMIDEIQAENDNGNLEELFVVMKRRDGDCFFSRISELVSRYRSIGMMEDLKLMILNGPAPK